MANKNVQVITDSNSGIFPEDGAKLGIGVVPMPVIVDGKEYLENVTLTRKQFFEWQEADRNIVTSQPAPETLIEMWDKALKEYKEVVYIPMSSGLSSSCQTAKVLAEDYDGRVQVVDNRRISVTMKQSVLEANYLAEQGWDAKKIHDLLEERGSQSSIYIAVDTMKYLKKGGRVTPAAAALATALNLKPVLQIQGGKLDTYAKVRGKKGAQEKMLQAIEDDMKNRFPKQKVLIKGAYTCSDEEAQEWLAKIRGRFPGYKITVDPLALSIAVHIGTGATAVVVMEQMDFMPELPFDASEW